MKKNLTPLRLPALCLAALLALSGCGATAAGETTSQADSASVSSSAATQATAATPEQTGETRTISTVMGDVEIPANPQRVVVDYVVGDVVAMGVTPVGYANIDEGLDITQTAFGAALKDAEFIGWDYDPETVMALEPDLIILSWGEEDYEQLSKIAPTIYVPYGEMSTEERVKLIGEALNKPEAAQQVLDDFNAKVENARQTLTDAGIAGQYITIAQVAEGHAWVAGNKHAVGQLLYNTMGLPVPAKVQTDIIDADQYWGDISMELFPQYVGDYFISLGDYPPEWDTDPVVQGIPAIAEGRSFTVPTTLTWFSDISSAGALVDLITEELVAHSK